MRLAHASDAIRLGFMKGAPVEPAMSRHFGWGRRHLEDGGSR